MAKRLAKNFRTESVSASTAVSTNFNLCVAMFTQAHATVEGRNTENMQSEDKRGRLLTLKMKQIINSILVVHFKYLQTIATVRKLVKTRCRQLDGRHRCRPTPVHKRKHSKADTSQNLIIWHDILIASGRRNARTKSQPFDPLPRHLFEWDRLSGARNLS